MTKAMAWSGLISVPGRYQTPFTAEWQSLWSLLPARQALARQLGRFFHYCSANDIRFRDIDDAVLCRFHEALVQESLIGKPYEAYRGAAKSWNNAREQIPGWPQTLVTVPSKRDKPFCLPWSAFPASLSGEIEAHLTSLAGFDLDSDIGRPMRPATIQKRRKQLCWLASALVHFAMAPSPSATRRSGSGGQRGSNVRVRSCSGGSLGLLVSAILALLGLVQGLDVHGLEQLISIRPARQPHGAAGFVPAHDAGTDVAREGLAQPR
jgi:hypothetical protein